jgi:hypothetical protein
MRSAIVILLLACGVLLAQPKPPRPCRATGDKNCTIVADKGGVTTLPGTAAISTTLPGASTAAGTIAAWVKYTVDVSSNAGFWTVSDKKGAALDADGSQQVALVTLPAKTVVHAIAIEHTVPFSGGAVATATVSVGTAALPTLLSDAYDVFQAITALPYENGGVKIGRRTSATLALVVQADTTGGNLSALAAGTVNIYLLTSVLP